MKKIISFTLSLTLFITWVLTEQNPHQFQKYASVINSGGAPQEKLELLVKVIAPCAILVV